jgi:hypothetical protein
MQVWLMKNTDSVNAANNVPLADGLITSNALNMFPRGDFRFMVTNIATDRFDSNSPFLGIEATTAPLVNFAASNPTIVGPVVY